MPHFTNPAAEELLDKEVKVLDKGFIRLVDYMGGDKRIVDAARVSYQGGTKQVRDDETLIRYLLRHKHTTPFEKVRFEFHVKLPIFVARQWIRHRTGSFNEMSARYSVMEDEFYNPDQLRAQSTTNKQGSEEVDDVTGIDKIYKQRMVHEEKEQYELYESLIKSNVTREQARIVLPINLYTQWYWTVDLWNLMHFMKLRSDSHAQWEIQEYSRVLEDCVKAVAPAAYQAFIDYHRDSVTFSRLEVEAIRGLLENYLSQRDKPVKVVENLAKHYVGMTTRKSDGKMTREFSEFLAKVGLDDTE